MIADIGLMEAATLMENALLFTLESGVHTGDFGDKSIKSLSTTEFAQAIVNNFGKIPAHNPKPFIANQPPTPTHFKLEKNPMLESLDLNKVSIVGVDMFIESNMQPKDIADKCLHHTAGIFKLVTISNRGTQVWPTGSSFTNLVNLYCARFESVGDVPVTQVDIMELYKRLSQDFKICSTELLDMWGDKKAYSLAQGQ